MFLTSAVVVLMLTGAPSDPPIEPKTGEPKRVPDAGLADLVKKLGHRSYRVREEAAKALLERGSDSVDALAMGIKDPDPEISTRCKLLLPRAESQERDKSLKAFLDDPTSKPNPNLPSVERFLRIVGDTKENREFYAELYTIHPALFVASGKDAKAITNEMKTFCNEINARWNSMMQRRQFSYDDILTRNEYAVFFFLSADSRVNKADPAFYNLYFLFYGQKIQKFLKGQDAPVAMRKLFVEWLDKEENSNILQQAMQLATNVDIKEMLPIILKKMRSTTVQAYTKGQMAAALVKLGSEEHIPDLAPLLKEKGVVTSVGFGNGKQHTVQIRDVALGVSIILMKKKPSDFGYDPDHDSQMKIGSYIYFGFPDEASREAAFKKWAEFNEKKAPPKEGAKKEDFKKEEPKKEEPKKEEPKKDEPKKDPVPQKK
jgi:hypothetical protein